MVAPMGLAAAIASMAAVTATAPRTPAAAALDWLAAVDQGRYADSWTQAGEMFRSRVTQEAWIAQVAPIRGPLGSMISRRLVGEQMKASLPGAPDGSYDILQFATDFTHKQAAGETLILAENGGRWAVVGYFIR